MSSRPRTRRQPRRAERLAFRAGLLVLLLLTALPSGVPAQTPSLPRPVALGADALAIACGPRGAFGPPIQAIQLIGSHEGTRFRTYSLTDSLVVGAGADQGLQTGQQYYVRRLTKRSELAVGGAYPLVLQTAGWIRLTAVYPTRAVAEIVQSCDGFLLGDYLEPFTEPVVPAPVGSPEPDYAQTARVLFGDQGRRTVATGDLALIDRGASDGIVPGQRLTIFRAHYPDGGPVTPVADAIALETMPAMTMIRLTASRGEVQGGDLVALHPVR